MKENSDEEQMYAGLQMSKKGHTNTFTTPRQLDLDSQKGYNYHAAGGDKFLPYSRTYRKAIDTRTHDRNEFSTWS